MRFLFKKCIFKEIMHDFGVNAGLLKKQCMILGLRGVSGRENA